MPRGHADSLDGKMKSAALSAQRRGTPQGGAAEFVREEFSSARCEAAS